MTTPEQTAGPGATMPGMTPGTHARTDAASRHDALGLLRAAGVEVAVTRKDWSVRQVALAALITLTVTALAPLFFAVLFTTVNGLLRPSFGWWAWTVPLATEVSFANLYLLSVLLVMRGKPARWLQWAPYPFAAASLWLNLAAAHGDRTAMVGHAALVVAFFTPLLAAKAAVRSLSTGDDEVSLNRAMADARRYAIDLMRDRRGIAWRWLPSSPSLLKRQIFSGRFPAAVSGAVRESLREYGTPWEPAVRDWVLGPEGLHLSEMAAAASRRTVSGIARDTAPDLSPSTLMDVPMAVHETPARDTAPGTPRDGHQGVSRDSTKRRPKPRPRAMSDDDLMPFVRDALAAAPGLSIAGTRKVTGTGPDRARKLLERAKRDRLQAVAK